MEVRAELEPWESQMIEHKGKLDVARSEGSLLKEKVITIEESVLLLLKAIEC